jgi:SUN domain-containing protein 1/2
VLSVNSRYFTYGVSVLLIFIVAAFGLREGLESARSRSDGFQLHMPDRLPTDIKLESWQESPYIDAATAFSSVKDSLSDAVQTIEASNPENLVQTVNSSASGNLESVFWGVRESLNDMSVGLESAASVLKQLQEQRLERQRQELQEADSARQEAMRLAEVINDVSTTIGKVADRLSEDSIAGPRQSSSALSQPAVMPSSDLVEANFPRVASVANSISFESGAILEAATEKAIKLRDIVKTSIGTLSRSLAERDGALGRENNSGDDFHDLKAMAQDLFQRTRERMVDDIASLVGPGIVSDAANADAETFTPPEPLANYAAGVRGARIFQGSSVSLFQEDGKPFTSVPLALSKGWDFVARVRKSTQIGYRSRYPQAVISHVVPPEEGHCFAFHGSEGQITVELSRRVHAESFSLYHPPTTSSLPGTTSSKPKSFSLIGWTEVPRLKGLWPLQKVVAGEKVDLGTFEYSTKPSASAWQTFVVTRTGKPSVRAISLDIHSNGGNEEHTCVYRIKLHGEPVLED